MSHADLPTLSPFQRIAEIEHLIPRLPSLDSVAPALAEVLRGPTVPPELADLFREEVDSASEFARFIPPYKFM